MTYEAITTFERTLKIDPIPAPMNKVLTDEEINEKYLKGEIRIVTEQARYPLNTIKGMIDSKDYILNPEFQRRHRWDNVKKSRLIESFIINIPIPPIFLYEVDFSVYEVMDGLQRLTAIKEFYEDKYALDGLEKWPELNGRKYSELPEQVRKGIDRRYLSSIILLKETAKTKSEADSLKQIVFGRINSGGAKLEDQEARNAQAPSIFNQMLIKLARNTDFCEIFDIPAPLSGEDVINGEIPEDLKSNRLFKSMKDVEIVLRFFALRVRHLWTEGTLTKYLDNYLYAMRNADEDIIREYSCLFEETIHLAKEIFEEHTFCLWKKTNSDEFKWAKNPTYLMYDPIMISLAEMLEHKERLISEKTQIIERFKTLLQEKEEIANGRNTALAHIRTRIESISLIFNSVIDA